jgi:hypothetical protein
MLGGWYSSCGAQSMSTKLLSWPFSCMVLSHMDHLSSPPAPYRALPSAKHPLVISSQTLRSLKWLRLPASRPCSSKHSFAGQDMSPGWKTIAYQRSYYNIYGELSTGHRDNGTPQKIYKVNRMNWRRTCTIYQATTSFKATRIDRRSGPVDVLDHHTGFESCAAVSHGQFFSHKFSN